jgi:hypothetical protein
MWQTLDGYTLRLPGAGLAAMISQLRQPSLNHILKRNYSGSIKQAAVRSMSQLASTAYRVGTLRNVRSGAGYPVFGAFVDGKLYYLITRPLDEVQNAIVRVQPEKALDGAEFMMTARQAQLTQKYPFTKTYSLATAPEGVRNDNIDRGIYQIFRNGKRIYNGKASAGNLYKRLQAHRLCLTHMQLPVNGYTVRVAPMPKKADPHIKKVEQAYRAKYPGRFKHQNLKEMEAF